MSTWAEAFPGFGWRYVFTARAAGGTRRGEGNGRARVTVPCAGTGPALADLVARVRTGDTAAFEHLYTALYPRVFRVARRYAPAGEPAEDFVHEAFLALWDRRGALDADLDVALYLITTVRHRAYNATRHDRYVRHVEETGGDAPDAPPGMGHAPAGVLDELEAAELRAVLVRAVDALPELQRRVVTFRWRSSLSYDAIAAELGITVKMVRLNLARAYETLRPFLRHLTEG